MFGFKSLDKINNKQTYTEVVIIDQLFFCLRILFNKKRKKTAILYFNAHNIQNTLHMHLFYLVHVDKLYYYMHRYPVCIDGGSSLYHYFRPYCLCGAGRALMSQCEYNVCSLSRSSFLL